MNTNLIVVVSKYPLKAFRHYIDYKLILPSNAIIKKTMLSIEIPNLIKYKFIKPRADYLNGYNFSSVIIEDYVDYDFILEAKVRAELMTARSL